jgi:hypothetical protein
LGAKWERLGDMEVVRRSLELYEVVKEVDGISEPVMRIGVKKVDC